MMTTTQTIGASDVPAILGLSPWQKPCDVWARLTGLTQASEGSNATRRGHTLELGILLEHADSLGVKLYPWATSHRHLHRQREPYRAGIYRGPSIEDDRICHAEVPWAGCRPDAIHLWPDGGKTLVEVKTTRSWRDWDAPDGTPILPPAYVVQVQWQMWVMGSGLTQVEAFCVQDDSRRSYTVSRNEAIIARIVAYVTAWREKHLVRGERPDDLTCEIAELVWPAPRDPETWVPPSEETREMVDQYRAAHAQQVAAEAMKDGLKAKLCNVIQDATGIEGLCTWKATKRGRQFRLIGDAI